MSRTFAAELRKLTTTRLWWSVAVGVLVLGAGFAVLPAVVELVRPDGEPFRSEGSVLAVYNGGNLASRILALVVGITTIGGEYRHQTMATTYLAVPRRGRVVAAKVAALGLVGLMYGALNQLAGVGVAVVVLRRGGGRFFLDDPRTWRSLALGAVSVALWSLIGMGLGVLVRRLGLALLVGVGFAYLVEPSLAAVFLLRGWDLPLNLLPTGATNAMLEVSSPILLSGPHPWSWWAGLLVLLGWCGVLAGIGSMLVLRRDV